MKAGLLKHSREQIQGKVPHKVCLHHFRDAHLHWHINFTENSHYHNQYLFKPYHNPKPHKFILAGTCFMSRKYKYTWSHTGSVTGQWTVAVMDNWWEKAGGDHSRAFPWNWRREKPWDDAVCLNDNDILISDNKQLISIMEQDTSCLCLFCG